MDKDKVESIVDLLGDVIFGKLMEENMRECYWVRIPKRSFDEGSLTHLLQWSFLDLPGVVATAEIDIEENVEWTLLDDRNGTCVESKGHLTLPIDQRVRDFIKANFLIPFTETR